MLTSPIKTLLALALASGSVTAHYANMGLPGVSCYIYNDIKGTTQGHMIVRNTNGTWYDHDDHSNHGNVTIIHGQADYDALPVKTKTGIVCVPDDVGGTDIGIPYVEMEPSDEEFYGGLPTVFQRGLKQLGRRITFRCIISFCLSSETIGETEERRV